MKKKNKKTNVKEEKNQKTNAKEEKNQNKKNKEGEETAAKERTNERKHSCTKKQVAVLNTIDFIKIVNTAVHALSKHTSFANY